MRPATDQDLDAVTGGLTAAVLSPIRITATNTAVVVAPQVNVNVLGIALQGFRFP